jgi:hypothetical protein
VREYAVHHADRAWSIRRRRATREAGDKRLTSRAYQLFIIGAALRNQHRVTRGFRSDSASGLARSRSGREALRGHRPTSTADMAAPRNPALSTRARAWERYALQ